MATPATQLDAALVETQVLEIVRDLLIEMGKPQVAAGVSLNSSFERELGIGSLDLVELLVRCEGRFEIELPDEIAEEAETPAGWVRAILHGGQEAITRPAYRIAPPSREGLPEPVSAATLVEALAQHAETDPGRIHIHLLEEDSGTGITYGQLFEAASSVAAGLAAEGLRRNDTVAIMLPSTEEFFYAFFGVMMAGGTAVPIYPPTRPDRIEDYVRRQIVILRNAGIRFLISFERVKAVSQFLRVNLPSVADVTTVAALRHARNRLGSGSVQLADVALLQYTSGSTGDPKGVALSNANLLANIRGIGEAVQVRPGDAVVTWLPLYSDLGLIGSWLFSLYHALPVTVLSPLDFLHRPERWLRAIHESRGTLSAAPNFAYELCTRRIPAWTLEGVDLSCWRVAVNAGEAVLPETVARFTERFGSFGFCAESMLPCYGLAESTVALTMAPIERLPVKDMIRRGPFETNGRAEPAQAGDRAELTFFSVGRPVQGQEVRIVDDANRDVGERVQGRLQFRGQSTASGYYRNPGATAGVLTSDGWMETGDLGYRAGGEVYIIGRDKDSIIKAGRSMSPLDVEAAVGALPGIQRGAAVAFGAADPKTGTERLVVVTETAANSEEDFQRIEAEIVRLVDEILGMPPDHVLLIEPGSLPKTSNGKIRRNEIRALYLKGRLRSGARPPWIQVLRLWWQNLGPLLRLTLGRVAASLYRASISTAASCIAAAAGVWVRLTGRRPLVRQAARLLLRTYRQPFSIGGECPEGPAVYIANRSGPLDPLVLAATLPADVFFADGAGLAGLPPLTAFLLKPLVGDRGRIQQALGAGRPALVLPESSIGVSPSRSRYRLDAFRAAVRTRTCLMPVAVRETGVTAKIEVLVGKGILACESEDVFQLRERIRETISKSYD